MTLSLDEVIRTVTNLTAEESAVIRKTEEGIYEVNIRRRNTFKDNGAHLLEKPFVEVCVADKDPFYGIIHIPKSVIALRHFPGYRCQFVLETSVKPFVMHLTGAESGTNKGDPKGGYLCHPGNPRIDSKFLDRVPVTKSKDASFKRFYDQTHVKGGQWVRIYRLEPELYRAEIL